MKDLSKKDKQELKLAGLIIMFAVLTYITPSVWRKYDRMPTSAAPALLQQNDVKPQPKPEYTIKTFFSLLDDGSVPEALSFMDRESTKYTREIWKEDFKNIYFIKLRNFQEIEKKDNTIKYQVRTDVRLKGQKLKSSWKNGENIRIVTIKLIDNEWKITDIAQK